MVLKFWRELIFKNSPDLACTEPFGNGGEPSSQIGRQLKVSSPATDHAS
jgi:hypothetical protein